MFKIIISLTMSLVGALAQAQVQETRQMENFSKIVVSDGVEVVITLESQPSLTAEAADALSLNDLITEVKRNTLFIHTKDVLDSPAKIRLSVSDLSSIEVLDGSKVSVTNAIVSNELKVKLSARSIFTGSVNADNMQLTLKSGSHFNGNIVSKKLKVDLNGSSVARLSGFVNQSSFSASNGSICDAKRLYTDRSDITATTNSNVMANADDDVTIDITEGSQASWAGYPETVTMPEDAKIVSKTTSAITGF
ncbi:DUF2807 domain-containing protein [Flavobacterium sp.]|uniref:GIN domain-containing protein n=1 Tax=Flavobacterium sp. TaxID=239 RepID=UPI0025C34083|nr:DUF2807 domain-containing protein [Flavobacterium sp.]